MKIMRVFQGLFREHSRNSTDTAQDILLLLYLLARSGKNISGKDVLMAKIKLMKLVFLAEYKMVEKKLKGFNFFFNIYKKGPSSKELLQLIDDLKRQNLIDFNDRTSTFSLTKLGEDTIKDFMETDGKNAVFYKLIDEIIEKYGKLSPEEILKLVYSMDIKPIYNNEIIRISKAVEEQNKKRLLMKLDEEDVKSELRVSPSWVETINVLMTSSLVE